MVRGGTVDLRLLHQPPAGVHAGLAGALAEIELMAELAAVFLLLAEKSDADIRPDQAQRQSRRTAEGILIRHEKLGMEQLLKQRLVEVIRIARHDCLRVL